MTTTYTSKACETCIRIGESDTCADCPNYKPLCATCDYGEESDNYEHFFECHNKATETVGKWYPVECDHHTAAKLVTVPPDSPSRECAGDSTAEPPKPAWHLIPHGPLAAVARIVAEGSVTHGDGRGWLERDGEDDFRAVLQHLFAWRRGETYDKDSGQHPLAHAAARLLMLADIEEVK